MNPVVYIVSKSNEKYLCDISCNTGTLHFDKYGLFVDVLNAPPAGAIMEVDVLSILQHGIEVEVASNIEGVFKTYKTSKNIAELLTIMGSALNVMFIGNVKRRLEDGTSYVQYLYVFKRNSLSDLQIIGGLI